MSSVEFSVDVSDIYNTLGKLPTSVLREAFSKGEIEYDSNTEKNYGLRLLDKNEENISHLKKFIKNTQSRGYTFELNDIEVFEEDVILQELLSVGSGVKIAIRHKGGCEGLYTSYKVPERLMEKFCGYLELSDVWFCNKTTNPSVIGKLILSWGVVLYNSKTQKNATDLVIDALDYLKVYVSNIVLFDPEVVSTITNACVSESDYDGRPFLMVEDYFSNRDNKNRFMYFSKLSKILIKCSPCLLTDYEWGYKNYLPTSEISNLVPLLRNIDADIYRIYMEGNTPRMESLINGVDYGLLIDNLLDFILHHIDVPIKECYIIDKGNKLKGKVIGRKCKDGEYIVTIY